MYPIRKIKPEEVDNALALALEVFMQFEAPDYHPEEVDTFKRDIIHNDDFIADCKQGVCPIYAAFDGNKIIGIIGMRSKTHINLVFVKKGYHRQGVATAIFRFLLHDLLNEHSEMREITLNSFVGTERRGNHARNDTLQGRTGFLKDSKMEIN